MKREDLNRVNNNDVAIIGLSGRFPGAENVDSFWEIIRDGRETISVYTREELLEKGVDPDLLNSPNYVYADSLIDTADKFDSSFFGYTPREADFMDPQHRVFLEECFMALENAGYDPDRYTGEIGLFAGCSSNRYLTKNLSQYQDVLNSLGELQTIVNNDKDFLTTRVSYKLNLKGPSVDIQTACSTSLVAIHFACQSLITNQCDIAMGGGVYIKAPRGEGYIFEEGSIDSPTGHCRPFDKEANGTVFGEGVGVIVLKRLDNAIKDRDNIVAVIKATAINNDGSLKVGYMAPSVSGQAKVISRAFKLADIDPDSVMYVETHGTGTRMGDPIEIEALRRVFMRNSLRINYCALGSVKANIGHLDTASGVAGVIKSILVLKHRQIPPLINFTTPNLELDIEKGPFYVNKDLRNWDTNNIPRRAGVSSFGIGGTNSHALLEEWIPERTPLSSKRFHLLPISAKTDSALTNTYNNLISHLSVTDNNIADIAYTLQNGRKEFKYRGILIWDGADGDKNVFSEFPYFKGIQNLVKPDTIFMFTGQGSQYTDMARGLYDNFESVKIIIDYADSLFKELSGISLLDIIFDNINGNKEQINDTAYAQPALFVVQYAIGTLLMEFGAVPDALIGHSIGEITAACFSGVFSFEDALKLVYWRGKLMQAQLPGSMLSVNLPKDQVIPLLDTNVELALHNAPNFCVVSGSFDDINNFEIKLLNEHPNCRLTRLKTSHAFHSRLMEPAIEPFLKVAEELEFGSVNIPFISNVTGTWITNDLAKSPRYWAKHIRSTVNFNDGISELLSNENRIYIEIGPGNSLSMFLSQYPSKIRLTTLSTLRHVRQTDNDLEFFFRSLSSFWLNGGRINWESTYADEYRYRVALPSYPFERRKHWIEARVKKSPGILVPDEKEQNGHSQVNQPDLADVKSDGNDLFHNRPSLDNEFIEPVSDLEKKISGIWEELLGIKGIGVNDNFFYLGGHSLLAIQIINRINEKFNSRITIDKFFNFPTIKGLIENGKFEEMVVPSDLSQSELNFDASIPLSPNQERIWILNQIDDKNPAYNISFTYYFEGDLNIDIFQKSINILFERHFIVFSVFKYKDGVPCCEIHPKPVGVEIIDFSKILSEKVIDNIYSFAGEDSRKLFDIESGPLYRLYLLRQDKQKLFFHVTVHHLIFDGWSWSLFMQELTGIYDSLLAGKAITLEEVKPNYLDYVRGLQHPDYKLNEESSSKFWVENLRGCSPKLNYPYDYPRKEIASGFGEKEDINISSVISDKLKEIAKNKVATPFATLFSVLGILFQRYSGENDICIGTHVANRSRSSLEKIFGMFVNTIPVRLKIDNNQKFSDFIDYTKNVLLEAIAHQELPFEKIVEAVNPERSTNVNPIFQVAVVWLSNSAKPMELAGIKSERVTVKEGVSPFDITFNLWENGSRIEGEIEYNIDVLNRDSIIRLRDNFVQLVKTLVDDPSQTISEIPIVSDIDKQKISEFNKTGVPVPDCLIHNLFEDQVNLVPSKTAIISGERKLTYQELENQSNQLANHLVELGVMAGDIVGICLERSVDMVVSVLAVLKAGGCYLPMDPLFPADRIGYMFEDSGARILISQSSLKGKFIHFPNHYIVLTDSDKSKIDKCGSGNPRLSNNRQSLAYLMYTSGSTGKPKGVKVHHQAVVNFLYSMSKRPGISVGDRLLAVTTLSFDISVLELFLPLSFGAQIIIADTEDIFDGQRLSALLDQYDVTFMQATPATWNILLSTGWKGKMNLKTLCGGEAILPGLVNDLLPKVESLWDMYGPTETTVWSTCKQLTDSEPPILVGTPIDNTTIEILDKYNKPLPVGVIGEVCIGGLGVTKGYHNRPELTAEKFIRIQNGQMIYKTGDLGRFLINGNIELFGRIDNQIKLRGFRIEPGEIESILSKLSGVKEVVVKVHKFDATDDRLVGFLNVDTGFKLTNEEITASLSQNLPAYMIPSFFKISDSFPRLPNGKINKRELKFELNDLPARESQNINKLTSSERKILEIWQDVLKAKDILTTDNFFVIGGNSLLAITVMTKIRTGLNIDLGLRVFFDSPRIKDLAEALDIQLQRKNKGGSFKRKDEERLTIIEGEI